MKKRKYTLQQRECPICLKQFERYLNIEKLKNDPNNVICCSPKCRGVYTKNEGLLRGQNNPNYGNTWTAKQRQNGSEISKERFKDPHMRYMVGSARRGKSFTFTEEHRRNIGIAQKGRTHSPEARKNIGIASAKKFNDEFKTKFRKTMESAGHWIPESEISDSERYYKESNWIDRMYDILVEENRYDNDVINPVRDHIVPRCWGYKHNIPVEIMRHPCNCQILSRGQNVKKRFSDKDKNMKVEFEQLLARIINYTGNWKEHDVAHKLAQELYENT